MAKKKMVKKKKVDYRSPIWAKNVIIGVLMAVVLTLVLAFVVMFCVLKNRELTSTQAKYLDVLPTLMQGFIEHSENDNCVIEIKDYGVDEDNEFYIDYTAAERINCKTLGDKTEARMYFWESEEMPHGYSYGFKVE